MDEMVFASVVKSDVRALVVRRTRNACPFVELSVRSTSCGASGVHNLRRRISAHHRRANAPCAHVRAQ